VAVKYIVLDSTPLGLIVHRQGFQPADDCRAWLARHMAVGVRAIVPEIVDYEVRRELLRIGKTAAIRALDEFCLAEPDRFVTFHTKALRLAAELWAQARRVGRPTADPHALDVDVILAAQALSAGYQPTEFVIATSNVTHLSQFVPAAQWEGI
jgi:predicted nucleic acid-binding protein